MPVDHSTRSERTSMRVSIYARYSSDKQREASIVDQVRLCEERAAREGWRVVKRYADHAISGASLMRRGIQALMQDAQSGKFDLVLTEALDRISRDQEDIAGVYKRLRFAGVRIYTLSEGEIAELHIGFTGTMSALYLKNLGEKTWRGQSGRVRSIGPSGLFPARFLTISLSGAWPCSTQSMIAAMAGAPTGFGPRPPAQ